MTVEHSDWKPSGRLGPDTLRRLVGGNLGNPDTPKKMEYLAGMDLSLGTLIRGLPPEEQQIEGEEDPWH